MSGLSLATVIMEAGETSGALRQADFALKQNRQILIPSKALEIETISWPKKYVDQGAQTVTSPRDIMQKLAESSVLNGEVKQEEQLSFDALIQKKPQKESYIFNHAKLLSFGQ